MGLLEKRGERRWQGRVSIRGLKWRVAVESWPPCGAWRQPTSLGQTVRGRLLFVQQRWDWTGLGR